MRVARLAGLLCVIALGTFALWQFERPEPAIADRPARRIDSAANAAQQRTTTTPADAAAPPATAQVAPFATMKAARRAHRDPRGETPFPHGNYASELPALKDAANRGDAYTAYTVFQILDLCAKLPMLRASNVPPERSDSLTNEERRASKAQAKFVGEIETDCKDVPPADIADRLVFLDRAAAGGDESAQTNYVNSALAVLAFDNRQDVVRNAEEIVRVKAEGMRYMEQAAAAGNTRALFNLAVAYRDGQVVSADPVMAYAYLEALQRTGLIKPALLQPRMDEWHASLSTGDLARAQAAAERIHASCCAP